MVFFLGKRKDQPQRQGYTADELAERYAAQGMPAPMIEERLRKAGVPESKISAAMNSALRGRVVGEPEAPAEEQQLPQGLMSEAMGPPPGMQMGPPQMGTQGRPQRIGQPPEHLAMPGQGPPMQVSNPSSPEFTFEPRPQQQFQTPEAEITLEEIIEGVVNEKWNDFEDRLGNFERRDIQLQSQIEDLRKRVIEMEKIMKEKEQTLGNKFDHFGDSLGEIEGRIGAIEKVFKEMLPALTDNMRSISDGIEKMKEEK